jgi:hypothetical protein
VRNYIVQIAVLAAVPCCSNCCTCHSPMLFKLLYLPQSHAVQIVVLAAVPRCSNCCTCHSPMLFKLLSITAVPCCSNCCTCRSPTLFKLLSITTVPCCSNCCTYRSPTLFKLLSITAVPCCSNCCLLPQSHAVQTSSNVRHLTTYKIRNWCLIQFSACTICAVYFFLSIKLNCIQLRQSEYISKRGLPDFSIALYKYIVLFYCGLYFLTFHIHKMHHEKAAMHLVLPRKGRIFV